MSGHEYQILRHKTAIRRRDLSLPLKCALRDEVIGSEHSVFDYGCGRGQDVDLLRAAGITCEGWDPAYYPDRPRLSADVVNLGYVINVIESPEERLSTLRDAWHLCRRLLIVSAQVTVSGRGNTQVEFGDGVVTSRGTFQKYFTQDELKAYLEKELNREAIAAGLGIFYAFKDEAAAQGFQAKRHRRREAIPRSRFTEVQFEEQREFLEPLMAAVARLGRVPEIDEFQQAEDLISRFGSLKNAFALIRRMTGEGQWRAIRERCIEDSLVYLALGRFRKRPPMSVLPIGLQRDIRAFFGSYSNACKQADELLFQAGNDEAIDVACRRSTVGKLLPDSLYVHRSALDDLAPLLRVYEGCARAYIGEIDGANVIKWHRHSCKVSYLCYPTFETDPHPPLLRSIKLSLRTREIQSYDYSNTSNPPILHRKETFLHPEHPLYEKFVRLSRQEEKHGLLEDTASIGTRNGWMNRLEQRGFALRGHRLVPITGMNETPH